MKERKRQFGPARDASLEDASTPAPNGRPRSIQTDRRVIVVSYLLAAMLFNQIEVSLVIGGIAAGFYFCVYKRNPRSIALVVSMVISFVIFQWVGAGIVRGILGRTHATDIDHRMRPNNPIVQTNGDGIRCTEESDAFQEADFNIIFCGDSFVYGFGIKDTKDVFPAVVQRICREREGLPNVHCANFGWTSSSPYLSLRLLKEKGAKYRPDLVVLSLDMTDFHDDLRYQFGKKLVGMSPIDYLALKTNISSELKNVRDRFQANRLLDSVTFFDVIIPRDRYFATNQPLSETAPYFEATERNLNGFADYCANTLHCDFIVVMHPRHFQYTDKESPDNWESEFYSPSGAFVLEPFKWLAQLDAQTPYACRSILDAFRDSKQFPLYLTDDPHWNVAGHRVAAEAIVDLLKNEALLP